jgi:hypothetical protein
MPRNLLISGKDSPCCYCKLLIWWVISPTLDFRRGGGTAFRRTRVPTLRAVSRKVVPWGLFCRSSLCGAMPFVLRKRLFALVDHLTRPWVDDPFSIPIACTVDHTLESHQNAGLLMKVAASCLLNERFSPRSVSTLQTKLAVHFHSGRDRNAERSCSRAIAGTPCPLFDGCALVLAKGYTTLIALGRSGFNRHI